MEEKNREETPPPSLPPLPPPQLPPPQLPPPLSPLPPPVTSTTVMTFSDDIPFQSMNMNPNLSFPIFDMMSCDPKSSPLAFMDLLGIPDFNPSLLDWLSAPTAAVTSAAQTIAGDDHTTAVHHPLPSPPSSSIPEYSSEVLNTPASPNSCSISTSSNDAAVNNGGDRPIGKHAAEDESGDRDGVRGDYQDQDKTKKQLKPKKKNQKKEKGARFAFMTQSEVDHLDDGFRWRKYGQKAVKNSPHPRSYYRCTMAGCGVKKHVERSSKDPSIVVTTYEGQHTHPSPATSRATLTSMHRAPGGALPNSLPNLIPAVLPQPQNYQTQFQFQFQFHQQQQQQQNVSTATTPPLSIVTPGSDNYMNSSSFNGYVLEGHGGFGGSRLVDHDHDQAVLTDNGLLQDIVVSTQIRRRVD